MTTTTRPVFIPTPAEYRAMVSRSRKLAAKRAARAGESMFTAPEWFAPSPATECPCGVVHTVDTDCA